MTFLSTDAKIATHAALTASHGVSGSILGSEDKDVADGVAGLDASSELDITTFPALGEYYVLTDDLLHSHDAEVTNGGISPVLVKTITLTGLYPTPVTLRILFDLKDSDGVYASYGQIYKNGSPVGTQRTRVASSYQTFTEDISFEEGDTLELYIWRIATGTHTAYAKNFRVSGTVAIDDYKDARTLGDAGVADAWNAANS